MSDDWLRAFSPDCDELLDRLLPQIDDGILLEIARADYGRDVEEHLAPLRLFRDVRAVPILEWHPSEVLELIRWSEPDQPAWKPGGQGQYGHLLRAFACSTLLRSYALAANHNRWNSVSATVVQLLDSLRALDGEFVPSGAKFFAWCLDVLTPLDEEESDNPFFGLALLSLSLIYPTRDDSSIISLCSWIDAKAEMLLSKNQSRLPQRVNGLLSLNSGSAKYGRWIEIGGELQEWSKMQPESDKSTWVALIGSSLA